MYVDYNITAIIVPGSLESLFSKLLANTAFEENSALAACAKPGTLLVTKRSPFLIVPTTFTGKTNVND